jgi:hypothetical protein
VHLAGRFVCVGLVVLCLSLAVGARSAPAATQYVDGISDQSIPAWDGGFSSAYFGGYFSANWIAGGHIRDARYVVQWNVMSEPSGGPDAYGDYRERLEAWYRDASDLGLTLELSLTAYAGPAPALGEYRLQLRRLLAELPAVRYLEAWNEPNDTPGLSASRAAEYTNSASALCAAQGSCEVIAGNLLDGPGMVLYEHEYVEGLRPPAHLWGVHPYFAVERHSEATIRAFAKALPEEGGGDQIWFTEVGAYACRSGRRYGEAAQARDAAWLTGELMANVRPTHVFYYEFLYKEHQPPPCGGTAGADTALYIPGSDPALPDVPRAAASYILADRAAAAVAAPLVLVESPLGEG